MNEKTKQQIEELKSIVRDLHRSAGKLDDMIQQIELCASQETTDSKYMLLIAASYSGIREDKKRVGFGDLDKRETTAWTNLLESLREEEA